MKRRVLFFTCELPPLAGLPTTGGGLRVHGLAEGLAARGHDVVLSVPEAKLADAGKHAKELAAHAHKPEELGRVIVDIRPDVLLFEQWGTATYLPDVDIPVVFDLHGALSLENAFRSGGDFTSDAFTKIETLAKADLLTCPGTNQRNYFLGWWMLAGADPRTARVEVVPVCLSPQTPRRKKAGGVRFVYSGAAWPWIDPFPGLQIVADKVDAAEGAALDLYLARPNIALAASSEETEYARFREIGERMSGKRGVSVLDPIPRDALLKEYLTATVAFDVYQRNPERDLAFTTRTVEYLWSGVPVIYGNYGELAALIHRYDAGFVVDPADESAIAAAVETALTDPKRLAAMSANAQTLAREQFAWDKAVRPLAEFVSTPTRRTGKRSILAGYKSVMDGYWEKLHADAIEKLDVKHRAEVKDYQSKIDELHDRAAAITKDKDREIKEVRAEHQKAERERDKKLERLEEQRNKEVAARDDQIRQLNERIWALTEDNKRDAQEAKTNAEKARENHARELNRRDEQLARLEAKFADMDRDYQTQLRQAADERREQIHARDEEMRLQRESKDRALAGLEDELRRTRDERTIQLDAKDREIEKAWAERTREVERRDRQIEKLQDRLEEQTREHGQLAEKLREVEPERERLRSEVGRLETELADTRAWATQLEEDAGRRIGALEQSLSDQEAAFAESEQAFAEMETTIFEQRDHIAFLGAEIERIQEEAEAHIRHLEREREDRDRMLGQLDHVRRDLEAKDRALTAMMKKYSPRRKLKVRRKARKVFRLYPRVAWLFAVNLLTNYYMERWQKKNKQQIFPGHVKAGN